jgi:hypothetical protein
MAEMGQGRRIDNAGAVSGPPPIATDWRAAIRAAVRSSGPQAAISHPCGHTANRFSFAAELPLGRAEGPLWELAAYVPTAGDHPEKSI